ncbi:hypothetical protein KBD69_01990 [Candidatus Woesebacteria bacterium]|nr:hypothetical protein [Candidatus Woesebacteria bacterium]
MTDHLNNQKLLQKQAYLVVEQLDLRNILNNVGDFQLVGSIEYGLMTSRDIDANLMMNESPTDSDFWSIVKPIFSKIGVKSITIADNRSGAEVDRPKSMYLGIKYEDNEKNIWKIDIRFLAKESVTTDRIAKLIEENITDETRQIILKIKSLVCDNPKYHKDFSSVDIYEAVLLSNVKNIADFNNYLLAIGKSL